MICFCLVRMWLNGILWKYLRIFVTAAVLNATFKALIPSLSFFFLGGGGSACSFGTRDFRPISKLDVYTS